MAGKVRVNQQIINHPGMKVDSRAKISVKAEKPYVSRGGYKLAAALDAFNVDPANAVCADVGASTGGFTDVLLQRGAKKVYALDVGYGILAWKLRQDPRVVTMERTNARKVENLPEKISLAVIDASFISLKLILPAVLKWIEPQATIIALIKPQFEAAKEKVGKGGVVRNKTTHAEVIYELTAWCKMHNLAVLNLIVSPITGPAGNREFLLHLNADSKQTSPDASLLVENCLQQLTYQVEHG
jgi:23S rRNA (cytidine1920-2'-O)/16S rRNA (cytidine1409-2'-O)-methyltransferase